MHGQRPPYRDAPRAKRTTPAERAEEFSAAQRRLKQEAAERRAAAESSGSAEPAGADAEPGEGED